MGNKKLIIGFMGLATSGKSTAAAALMAIAPDLIRTKAFADPLKKAAKALFLLSDEQLYGQLKEVIDPRWGVTPRQVLRLMGTDFVRNMIMRDFWVHRMGYNLDFSPYPVTVIDDVRFRDEAEMVLSRGGHLVLVDRLGLWAEPNAHASEQPPVDLANEIIHNDLGLKEFCKSVKGSKAAKLIRERLR